jgi:formate C-acetyltransferase
VAADFADCEDVRQRCLREPKYGNDIAEVDELAREFTDFVAAECARHEVLLNDRYYAGFFCWIMHQQLGAVTGASFDGRKAGFPFADGAGPAQGRERRGPTAAVKSTTSWDHTPMLGGLVLNLKFTPSAIDAPESQAKLAELLKTYMRLGGQEVQINVVRHEDLLAARENPSEYKDLVVRIAGYCDYFVALSPQMQEEVIARTSFEEV